MTLSHAILARRCFLALGIAGFLTAWSVGFLNTNALPEGAVLIGMGTALVGLIGSLISDYIVRQRKQELLIALCTAHGWQFTATNNSVLTDDLTHRAPGSPHGFSHRANNVIHGTSGSRQFTAFDYCYKTESRDSKGNRRVTTHRYAVLTIAVGVWLPSLRVTPEGVLGRTFNGLSGDIELESDAFNRAYRVTADDRKFAYDVLTPRLMETLLQRHSAGFRSSWRFGGDQMTLWTSGTQLPENIAEQLDTAQDVLSSIPRFVWDDAPVLSPTPPPSPSTGPAAGWYADPEQTAAHRWWNGQDWTEHTSP